MAHSLPAELLRAIFSAVVPPAADVDEVSSPWSSRTVLSFDERVRAELVCKHWRAALSEGPGHFTSLSVTPPWPGAGWNPAPGAKAAATAAVNKAVARASALAARAPAATHVHMQMMYKLPAKLLKAYLDALSALLSVDGGGRSFTLIASSPAHDGAEAALAAVAPHAACERLEIDWRTTGGQGFDLVPTKRLASLPHVRRMRARLDEGTMARFSLPMPRLEELTLPETPEMFAPIVSRAVGLVPPSNARSQPFPVLRRLSVTTRALVLHTSTMPALEHMGVKLYYPQVHLALTLPPSGTLPSSLTSLDLDASTMHTIQMMDESGDYGEDRSVRTNQLAPLLSAACQSVRQLALTIAEPPNADLAAALRAATRVTSLRLRFTSSEWAAQGATRLDCSLLGGMALLRTLSTDAAQRLDNPTALAALPLAELAIEGAAALPAIAPHTPGLTRLELAGCSAQELHGAEPAVGQALHGLTALRCLALGGREELSDSRSPETIAEAGGMQERHTAAMAALRALLPAVCGVQAAEPAVRLW